MLPDKYMTLLKTCVSCYELILTLFLSHNKEFNIKNKYRFYIVNIAYIFTKLPCILPNNFGNLIA